MKKSKKKTKGQLVWQKKHPDGKASFAWALSDYKVWQLEPPLCLLKNPFLTEGQQISNEGLETWFIDSVKTLMVLKEQDYQIFKKLHQEFILDVKYLISINRMNKENLDFILDEVIFEF